MEWWPTEFLLSWHSWKMEVSNYFQLATMVLIVPSFLFSISGLREKAFNKLKQMAEEQKTFFMDERYKSIIKDFPEFKNTIKKIHLVCKICGSDRMGSIDFREKVYLKLNFFCGHDQGVIKWPK